MWYTKGRCNLYSYVSPHTRQHSRIIRESLSRIRRQSPALPCGSPYLRDKSSFDLFCALVWDLTHFKLKTSIFLIRSAVSGAFLHVFSHWQRLFLGSKRWLRNLIVCTSCKTSYICPKSFPLGSGSICRVGRGGPLKFRGVVKKRGSPDFRSLEFGISGFVLFVSKVLTLFAWKLHCNWLWRQYTIQICVIPIRSRHFFLAPCYCGLSPLRTLNRHPKGAVIT